MSGRGRPSKKTGKNKKETSPLQSKCPECTKTVNDDEESVECEICQNWFHKNCAGVSDQLFAVMSTEETEHISWFCSGCKRGAKTIMMALTKITEKQEELEHRLDDVDNRQQRDVQGITKSISDINNRLDNLEGEKGSEATASTNPSETINELQDRERRTNNIVLFKAPESEAEDTTSRKADDITLVKKVCAEELQVEDIEVEFAIR